MYLLLIYITGCTTIAGGGNDSREARIVHVVLIWLKEPDNETNINTIINDARDLEKILEVQKLQVGKSISSNRAIVDDSFDVGLYMTFNSKDALESYLVHPRHIETVKTVILPLSDKILVYDFQELAYQ